MVLLNNILSKGFDGQNLILGLAAHIRNVMMARDTSTLPLLECSERMKKQYAEQAARCSNTFLYTALKILNRCDQEYRQSNNKRLLVEPDADRGGADNTACRQRHAGRGASAPQIENPVQNH